jgi:fermentation-respiration switch protein FrsA (DUF1100 family)
MVRILIFVAVLLTAIYALAFYLRRTGMFFPDRYPTGRWDPNLFMVVPSEHWFTTEDGIRLHAWLFEASAAGAPVAIWFHGNAGNLTDRADMGVELAKRGVSVFVFDYRGYGRSEGETSEAALFRDSLAAFDYVEGLRRGPIVLYGESVGGPYAAWVAKERPSARGVILENTFPSLAAMANVVTRPIPLGWTVPFAMRTTDWLNEAGRPVLVMHGTRDAVVPYALGRKLYDGLRVPKEMLTSNAGHCEIPIFDPHRYYDTVVRFVRNTTQVQEER